MKPVLSSTLAVGLMKAQKSVKQSIKSMGTTIALFAVVVPLFVISCSDKQVSGIAIDNRDSLAVMSTYGVSTVISDSGRISYKIDTEEWLIFDKRTPPYWAFEKGVYLEKYDYDMNVEATIECDTAYYYNEQKLWKLIGNVDIRNPKNERFFTDLMYWDQGKEKIYSDAYIKIEQEDQTTEGIGFSSNQSMTLWEIKNTKGIYTIKDE